MKRSVSFLLVISILLFSFSPLVVAQNAVYERGYRDGVNAGETDLEVIDRLLEVVWGFLLGPFSVFHSLTTRPKLPDRWQKRIADKSQDYKDGFVGGYRQVVEENELVSRIGGFGAWLVIWAVAIH
ncbi:MAG: hypothetical protein ACLFVS_07670 [Candidatus Acetothermia bacterium]